MRSTRLGICAWTCLTVTTGKQAPTKHHESSPPPPINHSIHQPPNHRYENSSRVFPTSGFDMQPPLKCAVSIDPSESNINDPSTPNNFWSVEVRNKTKSHRSVVIHFGEQAKLFLIKLTKVQLTYFLGLIFFRL